MSVRGAAILEYQDSQEPRHRWRFYIGDMETLLSHLRSLSFGAGQGLIAVCNVHMFITARRDEALASALSSATFAVCDGQPITWLAGLFVSRPVQRITGPELLSRILLEGGSPSRIALVGGTPSCLAKIETRLSATGKTVAIIDPGVVPASGTPDQRTIARLMEFAPDLVFVALGCPKQEKWASQAARLVPSTFIGVGAAFDYLAGDLRRAPRVLQRLGLEWLYRLVQQPHLLHRYITTNVPFMALLVRTTLSRPRPRQGPLR